MQFSENWLREWVNPAISTEELVAMLTMAGLEVDGVEPVAGSFSGVVVGEILSAEPHPNADKLQVCSVNVGEAESLQIVCGAPNARPGIKVPCAKVGAVLPENFKIKRAKLRGVESFGMLCAASELGLSESSAGLYELPDQAPVGQDLREYLQLEDCMIEVDLTPNRSDCLGIAGLAREVGVLNRVDLTPVAIPEIPQSIADTLPIKIEARQECPRYVGRVVKNVNVKAETPLWMVEKLRRSGIRSIDPVVDITNFVLLELGQPMHAFDLDKIHEGIHVRLADKGEKLVLLDGQEIELNSDTLVIADKTRALAMAGVMGGADSAVTEHTRHIFLESAFFEPIHIAGKARAYGLHTDSSHRFERGVDFQLQRKAIERASQLLLEITGGEPGPVLEEVCADELPHIHPIVLRREQIKRVLGFAMGDGEVEDILGRLGMDIVSQDDGWHIVPPSYRFDVRIEVDLIEELGRVWGYNRLPTRLPATSFTPSASAESRLTLDQFKRLLVDRDYQEAITYSFVDNELLGKLESECEPVKLANPISSDMSHMRTTLWAGLIKTALHNVHRQHQRVRVFESGLVFRRDGELRQIPRIAGLVLGRANEESWFGENREVDFYDIKGDVEAMLSLGGALNEYEFVKAEITALHPGRSALIQREGEVVGRLGALHPSLQSDLGFPGSVYLFELDLEPISNGKLPEFEELSRFPEVRRDLAVIVDENISAQSILKEVRAAAGDLLIGVVIFDVYQGSNVEKGCKSVAFGLTLQHRSRTLTDEEVNEVVQRVVASLKDRFNVILRE